MIVTKKAIPRRTVLRGLGATLALPLLDGMVPALTALAQTAASADHAGSASSTSPNGMIDEELDAGGRRRRRSSSRRCCSRSRRSAISCSCSAASTTSRRRRCRASRPAATRASARAFLTGVHAEADRGRRHPGRHLDRSDRRAASSGKQTQLASLELALESTELAGRLRRRLQLRLHQHALAGAAPTTPLPMENNPRAVFERLFGDSDSTDPAARLRAHRSRTAASSTR